MEGAVERALGAHLAREFIDSGKDGLDRQRIVPQPRPKTLEKRHGALDTLVVALVRRALAIAGQTLPW